MTEKEIAEIIARAEANMNAAIEALKQKWNNR